MMIQSSSSHHQLFVLVGMAIFFLLSSTVIHCRNIDTLPRTSSEDRAMSEEIFDVVENKQNIGAHYPEELLLFIRDALRSYPNRRSSFHAMRGKRRATRR
jgi:hypothetical protein